MPYDNMSYEGMNVCMRHDITGNCSWKCPAIGLDDCGYMTEHSKDFQIIINIDGVQLPESLLSREEYE